MSEDRKRDRDEEVKEFDETTVFVNRCAKVVKGGRRFSFSAVIVIGDHKGRVGLGFGKANEVSEAIRKATDAAHRNIVTITMKDKTIPHEVTGQCDGGRVLLKPASEGTGVIAGGAVRAVMECAGIKDVRAKSLRSNNPNNVVSATMEGLLSLRDASQVAAYRGKTAEELKA